MNLKSCFILFFLMALGTACNSGADSPDEARDYLLAVPRWGISEVYVNDALNYKDGKEVANFGGISFNRYMESVQFRPDGAFVGQYAGADAPTMLHWEIVPEKDHIVVTAADSTRDARSGWIITPLNVHQDSFEMTTETAAFDYPRITRIRLKFTAKE